MKLKTNLLINILNNTNVYNKYSNAFLSLKNVFELEKNNNFAFEKEIESEFEKLEKEYEKFLNDIPLKVVEKYYYLNAENPNKYVYIEYNSNEYNGKVIDIYLKLEIFFEKCFKIASLIADMYSLEIKINQRNKDEYSF